MNPITIPKQLHKTELRFIKVSKNGKIPLEKKWQETVNYSYNDPKLLEHIRYGNYGVCGGFGGLIVLDFDSQDIYDLVKDKLPTTFQVTSGSGLPHLYYFSDKTDGFKVKTKDKVTLVDVQGKGNMVVGANSIHPNGNIYVANHDEIVFIEYSLIEQLLKPLGYNEPDLKKTLEEDCIMVEVRPNDPTIDLIKRQISVPDLLSDYGIPTSKNPTECPLHSSKGGKCLSFNQELFNCFHCGTKGDIFSLCQAKENCEFAEAKKILATKCGILTQTKPEQSTITQDCLIAMAMKNTKKATELMAQEFMRKNRIYTTRLDEKSEMWIYQDGIYISQGRTYVTEYVRSIIGEAFTTYIGNQVVAKIECDTYIEPRLLFNEVVIREICLSNGILNIDTLELQPYTPDKIFFSKLPISYDPNAICPNIDTFFNQIVSSKEDVEGLFEIFGYLLWKQNMMEIAFMLIGEGSNGKSKLLEMMRRFVGSENCSAVSIQDIDNDHFALGQFFGKMANICGDLSNTALKGVGNFKTLTGTDLIHADRKFQNRLGFVNYAKLIFSCNELPMSLDLGYAFVRRWYFLKFPYTFKNQAEYDLAIDKTNLRVADTNIIDKIVTEVELSGLLNKALVGLSKVRQNQRFSHSGLSGDVRRIWLEKSDSFTLFLEERTTPVYGSLIPKSALNEKYHDFCIERNLKPKSLKEIKAIMDKFGYDDERILIDGEKVYAWRGVSLK
jgi:putative DNA primase/helicase